MILNYKISDKFGCSLEDRIRWERLEVSLYIAIMYLASYILSYPLACKLKDYVS